VNPKVRNYIKELKTKQKLHQCSNCGNYTFYCGKTTIEGISFYICSKCGAEL